MELPFLYSVEREYEVDLDRMWRAWTDAAELEQWHFPTELAAVPGVTVSDAEAGGRWKVAVDVAEHGFNAYFWGRYTDVETGRRLAHTLCYSQDRAEFDAADDNAPHHDIVVDFEERGGRVWVRFTQYGEMAAEQVPRTQAGMESYFDSLGAYLARN